MSQVRILYSLPFLTEPLGVFNLDQMNNSSNLVFVRRTLFVFVIVHAFMLYWLPLEPQSAVLLAGAGFLAVAGLVLVMRIEANRIRKDLISRLARREDRVLDDLTFRETMLIFNSRGKLARKSSVLRKVFYPLLFLVFWGVVLGPVLIGDQGRPRHFEVFVFLMLYLFLVSVLFLLHVFRFSESERRLALVVQDFEVMVPRRWTTGTKLNPSIIAEIFKMFWS